MENKERLPKARLEDLDFIIQKIVENMPVKYIYLFGSHAYGQPNADSDIDLYVVLHECEGNMREFRMKIKMVLAKSELWDIDILINTESDFKQRVIDYTLEEIVATKGKLLYESK